MSNERTATETDSLLNHHHHHHVDNHNDTDKKKDRVSNLLRSFVLTLSAVAVVWLIMSSSSLGSQQSVHRPYHPTSKPTSTTTTSTTTTTTTTSSEEDWIDDDHHPNLGLVQAMQGLQDQIQGTVVWPHDGAHFRQSSHVWNQCTLEQPPAVVIEAAHEEDVQVIIPVLHALWQNYSIPFRIRSGGHSYAAYSTLSQGIILSLSQLNHVDFAKNTGEDNYEVTVLGQGPTATVSVGPAVRVGDILNQVLLQHSYGSVIGWCKDVGEGGYTLGGGQGLLTRQYGLGMDNLQSARIVLATGDVVTATATNEYADLFWALRGAGQNNFGVVTQLTLTYHPVQDDMLLVTGLVDVSVAPAFLTAFGQLAPPRQAGAYFESDLVPTHKGSDGLLPVAVGFWWNGKNLTEGADYWKETLEGLLPTDVTDTFSYDTVSWYGMSMNNVPTHDGKRVQIYNGFLYPEQNTPEVWQIIWDHLWMICDQTPYGLADVEYWGGSSAFNDVKPNETAFYWRDAIFNVRMTLLVPVELGPDVFDEHRALCDTLWALIDPYLTGTYTNYAQARLENPVERTYGANLPRLQQIKKKYDPENLFFHPHSIPLPTDDDDQEQVTVHIAPPPATAASTKDELQRVKSLVMPP